MSAKIERPAVVSQGKAVAEQDGDGWLLMLPSGDVSYCESRSAVEATAKRWARKNSKLDSINTLELEWRFAAASAAPDQR